MWEMFGKALEKEPLVLIVVGTGLFVIAAAGGIPLTTTTILEPFWRIALALAGLLLGFGGWFFRHGQLPRSRQEINKDEYGVTINYPHNNDGVERVFECSGRFSKRPPDGFTIEVFELQPGGHSNRYRPRRTALINSHDNTWRAANVYAGDEPFNEKIYFVALVGYNGRILCDYYHEVGVTYNYEKRPAFINLPQDVYECARIHVHKKIAYDGPLPS